MSKVMILVNENEMIQQQLQRTIQNENEKRNENYHFVKKSDVI